jgi:hypothetical protein
MRLVTQRSTHWVVKLRAHLSSCTTTYPAPLLHFLFFFSTSYLSSFLCAASSDLGAHNPDTPGSRFRCVGPPRSAPSKERRNGRPRISEMPVSSGPPWDPVLNRALRPIFYRGGRKQPPARGKSHPICDIPSRLGYTCGCEKKRHDWSWGDWRGRRSGTGNGSVKPECRPHQTRRLFKYQPYRSHVNPHQH